MEPRMQYWKVAPDGAKALGAMHAYLLESPLGAKLIELIYLRISQINGCGYCLDLHCRELRRMGESQQRLDCLPAWRELPFYDARERAALAWAESLTKVDRTGADDADYLPLQQVFSEREIADLTFAIASMNMLNRIGVGFRRQPRPA